MKDNKFYINCPYDEKDLAKALGAKWDNDARKWYVPEGLDKNRFKRWRPKTSAQGKKPHLWVVK